MHADVQRQRDFALPSVELNTKTFDSLAKNGRRRKKVSLSAMNSAQKSKTNTANTEPIEKIVKYKTEQCIMIHKS